MDDAGAAGAAAALAMAWLGPLADSGGPGDADEPLPTLGSSASRRLPRVSAHVPPPGPPRRSPFPAAPAARSSSGTSPAGPPPLWRSRGGAASAAAAKRHVGRDRGARSGRRQAPPSAAAAAAEVSFSLSDASSPEGPRSSSGYTGASRGSAVRSVSPCGPRGPRRLSQASRRRRLLPSEAAAQALPARAQSLLPRALWGPSGLMGPRRTTSWQPGLLATRRGRALGPPAEGAPCSRRPLICSIPGVAGPHDAHLLPAAADRQGEPASSSSSNSGRVGPSAGGGPHAGGPRV